MNSVQIHLLLNHLPLFGSLFGTAILAWGLLQKQEPVKRLGLYLMLGSALAVLPVYFSGEGAEEAVEHLPGVLENLIEAHEDWAKAAMLLTEIVGLGALGGVIWSFKRQQLPMTFALVLLLLGAVNGGVMAETAHLGGQIRHSEIRSGSTQPADNGTAKSQNQPPESNEKHEKGEDHE